MELTGLFSTRTSSFATEAARLNRLLNGSQGHSDQQSRSEGPSRSDTRDAYTAFSARRDARNRVASGR